MYSERAMTACQSLTVPIDALEIQLANLFDRIMLIGETRGDIAVHGFRYITASEKDKCSGLRHRSTGNRAQDLDKHK